MEKYKVYLEDQEINCTITRSNRKSIGISIIPKEGVRIKAPKRATMVQIEEVINRNSKWIIEKLQAVEAISQEELVFRAGELFPYHGQKYTLQVIKNSNCKVDQVHLEGNLLNLYLRNDDDGEEYIKKTLIKWYKAEANNLLEKETKRLSQLTGLHPAGVKVKEQKSRFGSCSSKRNINLNWKLIMAPIKVIEYVIIHELCHLKEMNHSKVFWDLVEFYCEDYKSSRKWLKEKGGYIRLI